MQTFASLVQATWNTHQCKNDYIPYLYDVIYASYFFEVSSRTSSKYYLQVNVRHFREPVYHTFLLRKVLSRYSIIHASFCLCQIILSVLWSHKWSHLKHVFYQKAFTPQSQHSFQRPWYTFTRRCSIETLHLTKICILRS